MFFEARTALFVLSLQNLAGDVRLTDQEAFASASDRLLMVPMSPPLTKSRIVSLGIFVTLPIRIAVIGSIGLMVPAAPALMYARAGLPPDHCDPQVRRPDTALAEELLDWRPQVPWEKGLERTVAWFREEATVAGELPPESLVG